jgi:hypothetical protein
MIFLTMTETPYLWGNQRLRNLFKNCKIESSHSKIVLLILKVYDYFNDYLSHSGNSSRLCLVNVTNPVGSRKAIKEKK